MRASLTLPPLVASASPVLGTRQAFVGAVLSLPGSQALQYRGNRISAGSWFAFIPLASVGKAVIWV